MSEFVENYIKKYRPALLKSEKYIQENDWTLLGDIIVPEKGKPFNPKQEEFLVQDQSILILVDRLKFFAKKASGQHRLPKFKTYVKHVMKVINMHMDRIDGYINGVSLEDIKTTDLKLEEMNFHNLLQKKYNTIDDAVESLDLKFSDENTNSIEFLSDVKAPLSMHKVLMTIPEYAEIIQKELDYKKIDFTTPPNNEMLIYMDNVPRWDINLHYWEQEAKVLQFYVDEFKKLRLGINIDGVYISGWAYYHMNIYIAPIPVNTWNETKQKFFSQDVKMNCPLRDSDYMIFENRDRLEDSEYKILFLACSRRVAKTTTEASMLAHAVTIGEETLLCAGASTKDLEQLAKNFKIDMLNKNNAFRVFNVSNDWSKKIELGIKTKSNKTILLSTLHIINTDSGNNKEVFAGFSPTGVIVIDEALKSDFLEALESLIPALVGKDGGIRARVIISGTAGTESLSADGIKALNDPETYGVMPMQWDILERGVTPDNITWEEDKSRPFGAFIPGQCRVDMPKIESTLADYLGRPESKELRKIKIKVTDWAKAKEKIEKEREDASKDKIKLHKTVIYAPVKPSEITMSGKQNRFPVAEAKAHKQYLLETGLWDRRRDVYKDTTGKIHAIFTKKELAPFPHKGGFMDAPFLIFEDLPQEKPKVGMYTAGFDDYATDDSETSSLATFYVMKNKVIGDPFSEKIVASISFRPEKHQEVYEKWVLLMEAYNLSQSCFGENFNYAIKDYLEKRHLADTYLAPSLDFSTAFTIPNNGKRKTGWNPSTSKKFLFDLFVDYCNEEFEIEQEDGTIKVLKGVQRIDDIGLLDEIIQWSENLNVDRITSAMGAYAYLFYLQSSFKWKVKMYVSEDKQNEPQKPQQQRDRQFFASSGRNRSFFNRRR
jgi:hypothetical protein